MRHALILTAMLLPASGTFAQPQTEAPPPVGRIEGRLVTADGQVSHTGCATVFICDATTGRPLITNAADEHQPFGVAAFSGGLNELWHSDTRDDGAFVFEAVPPGEYRLVAQSWAGVNGVPQGQGNTSETIILHGTAEHVTVTADQTTKAYLRKLGDGVLHVVNDPQEAGAYLLISTEPTLGDPILGPFGWGEPFINHVIAITHMSKPRAVIVGLPEDQTVHLAAFFYDNVAGSAGCEAVADGNQKAVLNIYAGWSNGHDDPPAALLPLVEYLEKDNPSLSQLLQSPAYDQLIDKHGNVSDGSGLMRFLAEHGDDVVNVANLGEFRIKDVLAAKGYRLLREHHQQRRKKNEAKP